MSDWQIFLKNITKSLSSPIKSPYFFFYFLFFVVGVGGSGIWLLCSEELMNNYKGGDINFAFISFSIVLLITSGVDIILKENSNKNGFTIIGISALFLLPTFMVILMFLLPEKCLFLLSGAAYLISLLAWWISNGDRDIFTGPLLDMDLLDKNMNNVEAKRKTSKTSN